MGVEQKKTNCHFCGYLCGFVATVEDGRVIDLVPDPTRYPYDERILQGCVRWKKNIDVLDSSGRINFPLKRAGERGCGQWERVSWDDALDGIASGLKSLREEYGAGTLASMIGGPHTSFWPLHRFMTLFGSPNNVGIGQICWNPRIWMDALTFGWTVEADITSATNSVFVWGTNPAESDNSAFWRALLAIAKDEGTALVVVDPRFTTTARFADVWVAPKPGSDAALMLSMINVIIEEDLYDHGFVDEWCIGFEGLREHVRKFAPEAVSETCGVEADLIRKIARIFADSPSAIVSGRGIDQIGRNVAPSHRARCILLAITGNVDRSGACMILDASDFVSEVELECTLEHFEELASLSLNRGITPLQTYEGYDMVRKNTEKLGRTLPARYLTSAHPDLVLHAMETGEPYPIRALIVEATNPLLTYADTNRVYKALLSLDLIVVLDYYMTPTAAIADYILPSAGAIERATFQAHGGVANQAYGGDGACRPYYERKSDYEIFRELGLRFGQGRLWPEKSFSEACEMTLAPTGMDWSDYCELGMYAVPVRPEKHLESDADGKKRGFATPSGKIELANSSICALGGEEFPSPSENCRLCSDGFIEQKLDEGWKHIEMITGGRKQPYNASMYMNDPEFRARRGAPILEMSENSARELGLCEGDVAEIATDQGNAFFKVGIVRMRDGLVHADYGWWHPEWDMFDGSLGGTFESNINLLTKCSLEDAEPLIGTWSYNALDCMIRKSSHRLSFDVCDNGFDAVGKTRTAWPGKNEIQ